MLAIVDGEERARRVADAVTSMVENHVEGLWVRVLSASAEGATVTELG